MAKELVVERLPLSKLPQLNKKKSLPAPGDDYEMQQVIVESNSLLVFWRKPAETTVEVDLKGNSCWPGEWEYKFQSVDTRGGVTSHQMEKLAKDGYVPAFDLYGINGPRWRPTKEDDSQFVVFIRPKRT